MSWHMSPRYGHVILVSGYPVLTAVNWPFVNVQDVDLPRHAWDTLPSLLIVVALNATRDCIRDLQDWLVRDRLKLNDNKTEFLLIGTRQQLVKVNLSRITVGNEAIEVLGK